MTTGSANCSVWLASQQKLSCLFFSPLLNILYTVYPVALNITHMSPLLSTKHLPCLIQTLCTSGLLGLFPSLHSSHDNPQKHQLQRESCSFFMQANFLSSWVAMYVTYCIFQLSPCLLFWNNDLCYPIYMMLLLYFRPVTEKKTPLLRNHSICSSPQRESSCT